MKLYKAFPVKKKSIEFVMGSEDSHGSHVMD